MGWVDNTVMVAKTSTRDRVSGEWMGRSKPLSDGMEGLRMRMRMRSRLSLGGREVAPL